MPDINITAYDNEDINRTFVLKSGTAQSSTPIDISLCNYEADIVDRKTGAVVLRLTTNEGDDRIVITDGPNGTLEFRIAQGLIAYAKRSLQYDLVQIDQAGTKNRLWGGTVKILDGTTKP